MPNLIVELYGTRVGRLAESRGAFDFVPDPDAVERYGIGSTILSFAIPLSNHLRPEDAVLRRNFFDEVLPEGRARARLAGNARIAPDYTIGMLRRYGRDVAGALQIWDPDDPREPRVPSVSPVSDARVRELLAEVKSSPIGNTSVRRLSSLAGIQDKIVLARDGDGWAEPLDGYPSTHIIKPVTGEHPTLIFDEEYGARIARHVGLTTFDTRISSFDGVSALVIERYDRSARAPGGRVHQEDFNQALGFSGDGKYESHGHPGLAAIARLLLEHIGRTALDQLLRLTTMSVAAGNLDMHAKNISVLHHPSDDAQLAPAYDIVPQLHLPVDDEFAFSVNGTMLHEEITRDDLAAEGAAWGVRGAEEIVDETIAKVADYVARERPLPGAHHSLASDIAMICENLAMGRGAGSRAAHEVVGRSAPTRRSREGGRVPIENPPGGWGGPPRT